MGIDSRGVNRGKCHNCDCESFEAKTGQSECGYGGCFPMRHDKITDLRSGEANKHASQGVHEEVFIGHILCYKNSVLCSYFIQGN